MPHAECSDRTVVDLKIVGRAYPGQQISSAGKYAGRELLDMQVTVLETGETERLNECYRYNRGRYA